MTEDATQPTDDAGYPILKGVVNLDLIPEDLSIKGMLKEIDEVNHGKQCS